MLHPSEELRSTKSAKLEGKTIVLGITGSIAAVETVKLARELIRHGAEVFAVMSFEAHKIIHPNAVEFATGNKPITEITGKVEHVSLCGSTKSKASLLLIAPCTANTISKIACGIDDTPVTTFATTALSSKIPIIIVPAMHSSMYEHEIVQENIKKLKKLGIEFIEPRVEEGKAKLASIGEIVERVIRKLWKNDLENKKILVIAGSTAEPIDDVRFIAAKSSGRTGIEIAKCAFERGAEVELLYGSALEQAPNYLKTERFQSTDDLRRKLKNLASYNVIICPAAISDYIPKKEAGKLSSEKKHLLLSLTQAPKILELIRKDYKKYLVGFKLESNVSREVLLERAYRKLKSEKLDLIVANDLKNISHESSEVLIIDRNKNFIFVKDRKEKIADRILDKIKEDL
ncbi:MAG: bifunctional phosphopantothenoylcysteine decarboxylase/phosphopantothenate--cysteine ligase CoaBC [Candidatus Thermoplasmatota archaeon]|nr:bifunctional phosphopantothenoylcysteine decarboxylase/phosphopantothenate--cysteine ligase CoaBC [Candidatus Thermoplasmatota archaeon]